MQQNNGNFPSGSRVDGLLKMVAEKMGKTPQQLQQELQSGQVQNPEVQKILGNKDELQQLMNSPQVQKLLEELRKK